VGWGAQSSPFSVDFPIASGLSEASRCCGLYESLVVCVSVQQCNSLGQCHCEDGYGPPDCSQPGGGGSYHSNPISPYTPRKCSHACTYLCRGLLPFSTTFLVAWLAWKSLQLRGRGRGPFWCVTMSGAEYNDAHFSVQLCRYILVTRRTLYSTFARSLSGPKFYTDHTEHPYSSIPKSPNDCLSLAALRHLSRR